MREIKFRAWDVEMKEWTDMGIHVINIGGVWSFNGLKGDLIICQYTGLKDVNGVEIYEGDVVIAEMLEPPKCAGVVVWNNEVSGWNVYEKAEHSTDHLHFDDLGEFVVIGNIYENPELI